MTAIFTETGIPEDTDTFNPAPESSDLRCEVCGTPLAYGGRGRKPKFCDDHKPKTAIKKPVTRTSADVNSALATMDQFYRGVGFLVYLLATKPRDRSTPRPAHEWNEVQVPKLLATDREIFTADPKLCARINSVGAKGGTGMFIFAHTLAIIPVVQLLQADIAERQMAMRQAAQAAEAATPGPDGMPDKNAQYM